MDILMLMDNGNFDKALKLSNKAVLEYKHILEDEEQIKHDQGLPSFLHKYTSGYALLKILTSRVEILQKFRDYSAAVAQLEDLLNEKIYCQSFRGYWWERLSLNLDQHLKQSKKAAKVVHQALLDEHVRYGYRFTLFQRAQRICSVTGNKKLAKFLKALPEAQIKEAPKVFIQGRLFPKAVPGGRSLFISPDSNYREGCFDEDMVICSVEEFALRHYQIQGFEEGIHGEGSTFITLLGLLFWDIIFTSGIPDAFRSHYQVGPLDLRRGEFYENRKELIDSRLNFLSNCSSEVLKEEASKCWNSHYNENCCLISWEVFHDIDQINSLIECLKNEELVGIFSRIIKTQHHRQRGMPDLTMWSPSKKTFKVVEVKGPNDHLSVEQILWLDYFLSLGIKAEVCHVTELCGKNLPIFFWLRHPTWRLALIFSAGLACLMSLWQAVGLELFHSYIPVF